MRLWHLVSSFVPSHMLECAVDRDKKGSRAEANGNEDAQTDLFSNFRINVPLVLVG